MVVDSGTTFTMLPSDAHHRLTAKFRQQMEMRGFVAISDAEERTGLVPYYEYENESAYIWESNLLSEICIDDMGLAEVEHILESKAGINRCGRLRRSWRSCDILKDGEHLDLMLSYATCALPRRIQLGERPSLESHIDE
ncbi:hypothetical protein KSP40_PGU013883 [Platanthera guangdongensis]|uniref:Peptidase A1 domain-containing protein n=1 Tax=Platanthera guangdongensis TaxID=2320717 RepID=A0ABR2MD43_9ASPA